ncbi:AAA family ATPase [Candidatus Enterovibrio escicola]|uniref:AAA family ATPase n=2 Tax=Candidatus Enterovibrio escicola TaxID=1927127 RepID=UPI001680B06D|nr:AAA family ATPase [Candidatus Enterovibrio escacola]
MKFDDFIFSSALQSKLQFFLDNPSKTPNLCFHAYPGTGKTTFAKYLANEIATDVRYYDINAYKADAKTSSSVIQSINECNTTVTRFMQNAEPKQFDIAFIVDEFHNASLRNQDSYKIRTEEMSKTHNAIFIFILNTEVHDKKATYAKRVSPAMRSRLYEVDFNIKIHEHDEVFALAKKKFPQLPDSVIRTQVMKNDLRQLSMRAKMMS